MNRMTKHFSTYSHSHLDVWRCQYLCQAHSQKQKAAKRYKGKGEISIIGLYGGSY